MVEEEGSQQLKVHGIPILTARENSAYLRVVKIKLSDTIHVQCLAQCPAHAKDPINAC